MNKAYIVTSMFKPHYKQLKIIIEPFNYSTNKIQFYITAIDIYSCFNIHLICKKAFDIISIWITLYKCIQIIISLDTYRRKFIIFVLSLR